MSLIEIFQQRSILKDKGITFFSASDAEFLSYSSLYDLALGLLYELNERKITRGNELVFQIEDNKLFAITFWACILGGIIPVPVSVGKNESHRTKIYQIWKLLNKPYLVTSSEILQKLQEHANEYNLTSEYTEIQENFINVSNIGKSNGHGTIQLADADDLAFIQFSSGSTGTPKGVELTHANLLANINAISIAANYSENDSMLNWMPLTHDMGLIGFHINPLFSGIDQYHIPTELFIRRPTMWMDKASEYRATILSSPNFGYKYLLNFIGSEKRNWDLSKVRLIYNGAEPISVGLCEDFIQQLADFGLRHSAICPVYGLAEASVAVSISDVDQQFSTLYLDRYKLGLGDQIKQLSEFEEGIAIPSVGRSVDDCSIRITDDKNVPVADEVVGKIHIRGKNVTSCYYNNQIKSREVIDDDGWLFTGDLGFLYGGNLYITGREKDIFFVNGQNYYSHDVERAAQRIEQIELNKVVIAGLFNEDTQRDEIVAFVLYRGKLEKFGSIALNLKSHINREFGFEISHVIPVKKIPKTTSGKLQRFYLLDKYREGKFDGIIDCLTELTHNQLVSGRSHSPTNEIESKLLEIWTRVFKNSQIGINQGFFELGGNSLKAAEIGMNILEEFHFEISLGTIYEKQSIKQLAIELETLGDKEFRKFTRADVHSSQILPSAQRRIYYVHQISPNSTAYNIPTLFSVNAKIDQRKLESCIQKLILRHSVLRMVFHLIEEPEFEVKSNIAFKLEKTSIKNKGELKNAAKALIKPFDLANGPLFRIGLLETPDRDNYLFLDFHHIIADGMSTYYFLEDLWSLYFDKPLRNLRASYDDFAAWEYERRGEDRSNLLNFWQKQFDGEWPVLNLPTDYTRPALLATEGEKINFELEKETIRELRSMSIQYEVTMNELLLTLYIILLIKWTEQDDVVVGIPTAGRKHPDLYGVVGMFVNNLAIRTQVERASSFLEILKEVAGIVRKAIAHEEFSFEDLVQLDEKARDPSRNPVFDTMFLYQNLGLPNVSGAEFKLSKEFFDSGTSKYDLTLEVEENDDELKLTIEYSTNLFRKDTILDLCQYYKNLLSHVISDPEIKVSNLFLMSTDEFRKSLDDIQFTSTQPKLTAHELFEEQVRKTPNAVAIEEDGTELSFQQIDAMANTLASSLREKGLKNGDLVAILLPRSSELIISILGILKAGGAFIPIDLGLPEKRIELLISDSCCNWAIIDCETKPVDSKCEVWKIKELLDGKDMTPLIKTSPDELAYVIYTSGSTGQPKGVMIEHQSLVNYISWARETYTENQKITFPLYSSISFDLTITSIFIPLASGNKIVIFREDDDELLIEKVIKDPKIEIVKLTPSHLRIVIDNNLLSSDSSISKIIVGGEQFDSRLAHEAYKRMNGNVKIYNEYGPTEATVGCMIHTYDTSDPYANVPIGSSIENTSIYILDKDANLVPAMVPGELHISGNCLARGYLNNSERTNEVFVESPFLDGLKMYKTGDIARSHKNGVIEFLGRRDNQVKINGYRIELSEIEYLLCKYQDILQVYVLAHDGRKGQRVLTAYYTREQEHEFPISELKEYLAGVVPHYMVPFHFVKIDSIPVTKNGKVDIDSLPSMTEEITGSEVPASEIEKKIISIWEDVLGVEKINLTDNFYELGGDSIKATQIASRLFSIGIYLEIKNILTYHTIKQISRYVTLIDSAEHTYEQNFIKGDITPTPIQQWFFHQDLTNKNHYNQCISLTLKRRINKETLKKAFSSIVKSHDGLRLNYDKARKVLFYNDEHINHEFQIDEFEVNDETSKDEIHTISEKLNRSFDLRKSLLIKAALIHIRGGDSKLFITAHHLVVDGVSWRILIEDFVNLCLHYDSGLEFELGPKTASIKHWTQELNLHFRNQVAPSSVGEFWSHNEHVVESIPFDMETDDWNFENHQSVTKSLDEKYTAILQRKINAVYGIDVSVVLNLAVALALRDWTGKKSYVIEQENSGRYLDKVDISRTVGWFTGLFPCQITLDNNIEDQIKTVKEQIKNIPYQGIFYGVEKFTKKDIKENLAQVRINYMGDFDRTLNNDLFLFNNDDFSYLSSDANNRMTSIIEVNAIIVDGVFEFTCSYNRKAHLKESIDSLVQNTKNHLEHILNHINKEETIHYTPSDFSASGIDRDDIETIFN